MSDPRSPEIIGYIEPTDAEMKARKNRNIAMAIGLAGFVGAVFLMMLYKFGVFG